MANVIQVKGKTTPGMTVKCKLEKAPAPAARLGQFSPSTSASSISKHDYNINGHWPRLHSISYQKDALKM